MNGEGKRHLFGGNRERIWKIHTTLVRQELMGLILPYIFTRWKSWWAPPSPQMFCSWSCLFLERFKQQGETSCPESLILFNKGWKEVSITIWACRNLESSTKATHSLLQNLLHTFVVFFLNKHCTLLSHRMRFNVNIIFRTDLCLPKRMNGSLDMYGVKASYNR